MKATKSQQTWNGWRPNEWSINRRPKLEASRHSWWIQAPREQFTETCKAQTGLTYAKDEWRD